VAIALTGLPDDQAGRALAAWAVAHATGMGISDVSVDQQTWTEHAWHSDDQAQPAGVVEITVAP
jgi:hypothetical protein